MTTNKQFTTTNWANKRRSTKRPAGLYFCVFNQEKMPAEAAATPLLLPNCERWQWRGRGADRRWWRGDRGGPAIFAWVLKHVLRKRHRCTAETQAQGYGVLTATDVDDEQQQRPSQSCAAGPCCCFRFCELFGRGTREIESDSVSELWMGVCACEILLQPYGITYIDTFATDFFMVQCACFRDNFSKHLDFFSMQTQRFRRSVPKLEITLHLDKIQPTRRMINPLSLVGACALHIMYASARLENNFGIKQKTQVTSTQTSKWQSRTKSVSAGLSLRK